ncbi:MAG: AAA family ATPase, partial [Thermodesulfobacteriota bacterium]|nr:AAA family ATPase [Thermodesulfobacteriota bacterium]
MTAIRDKGVFTSQEEKKVSSLDKIDFNIKPEELKEHLDQYIIKQDKAKSIIATKVCTHFNRIKFNRNLPQEDGGRSVGQIKNNIIMIGPTGVGKTYMIKLVAKKLGVPMVKADATKFSETGYVGGDVEDLIRQLYQEAGEDKELAEHGIVYLDEIDKIAATSNLIGPDVSRSGVQRTLLKPMEETEVDLKTPHDPISQLQAIEQYRRS